MPHSLCQEFAKIAKILKNAKTILIVSHEIPDADAVGSVLALHHALLQWQARSFCYLPDPPPKYLNFLPGFSEIHHKIPAVFLHPQVVLGLDYGDFIRLKLPQSLSAGNFITIDHHRGDQRGKIQIVRPDFSSTSEIIYEFLRKSGFKIDPVIASCLLSGLVADTGVFSYVSTTSRTFRVAGELLLKGAPFRKIVNSLQGGSLRFEGVKSATKLYGRALARIKFDKETSLVYSFLSKPELDEFAVTIADLGGVSSMLSRIYPANFSLFLVEYDYGKIKGSLRSEPSCGKKVDSLAQVLGGGGHPHASGFKCQGTIDDALQRVRGLLKDAAEPDKN